jgi:hypothetical protein
MPETVVVPRRGSSRVGSGTGGFALRRGRRYRPASVGEDGDDQKVGKRRTEGRMAIDLSLFNSSVTTILDHLTQYHGDDAELETYVICARVKSPDIPGGSGINWIVNPGGEKLAGGLLREVLKAVEGNGGNGNGHGPSS